MIAVIGEKPSVARDIARILGANEKQDGYLSGNGYLVTWAFGHLVGLAMPEAYGIQSFRRESLPIIPDNFQLTPRQVKAEKGYKADPGALKQLKVIKEVFDQSDKIIVATDAGREGELIFRYIYQYIGCNKPFVRLWISSLTDKAIREGLQNLKAGRPYDNLFGTGTQRSRLFNWHKRYTGFKRGSRTRHFFFGTSTVAHVGDDMYPLFREQELCPAKVLATEITDN